MTGAERTMRELFREAGVSIDSDDPWGIRVLNQRFYRRVLANGTLGFGESYMDEWWETDDLSELVYRLTHTGMAAKVKKNPRLALFALGAILANRGGKSRAFEVGERHYDLGNDLYQAMLDRRMVYSCGYWREARDLNEAQEAKLGLICRKIGLQSGMTVWDVGCGWGSFAKYAAERYGASVLGTTVSKEQAEFARNATEGMPVTIRVEDYRDTKGAFDRIVSIGMFEHVGYKNYRTFMEVARDNLKEGGLFLLHAIGGDRSKVAADPWMDKYIFPNGMLPSIAQIGKAIEGLFVMEDWHNFSADYEKTLAAWFENFNRNWNALKDKYGDRFYRMWKFYLLGCAGVFRARGMQLWQVVLSPKGVPGGYRSIR